MSVDLAVSGVSAAGGRAAIAAAAGWAAALNYTGYRHVVATMWSVDPTAAAEVTEAVYPAMIADGNFVADRSAGARHQTMRTIRDGGRPLDG